MTKPSNPRLSKIKTYVSNYTLSLESCSICFEDLGNDFFTTNCNHLFHEDCLKKWFEVKTKILLSLPVIKPVIKVNFKHRITVYVHYAEMRSLKTNMIIEMKLDMICYDTSTTSHLVSNTN